MTIGEHQHLSSFASVREIYENDYKSCAGYRSAALIVPAVSGHKARYHVYRLDFERGDLVMIGCELPLDHSRAIARRSRNRDWQPLSDFEKTVGRWPRARWEDKGRSSWQPYNGPSKSP